MKSEGLFKRLVLFGASGLGAGYVPKAPGTAGAAAALPLCWWITTLDPVPASAVVLAVAAVSVALAHEAEKLLGTKDPSLVTVDEVAGMAVAFLFHDFSILSAAALFALFRLFDIWKPFPVKQLDKRLSGGFGIVLDDVAAGIYANLVWSLAAWILGQG